MPLAFINPQGAKMSVEGFKIFWSVEIYVVYMKFLCKTYTIELFSQDIYANLWLFMTIPYMFNGFSCMYHRCITSIMYMAHILHQNYVIDALITNNLHTYSTIITHKHARLCDGYINRFNFHSPVVYTEWGYPAPPVWFYQMGVGSFAGLFHCCAGGGSWISSAAAPTRGSPSQQGGPPGEVPRLAPSEEIQWTAGLRVLFVAHSYFFRGF